MELIKKIQTNTNTETEYEEFKKLHQKRSFEILEKPVDALFDITETKIDLPPKAKIESSIPCGRCGEPTMTSKLSEVKGVLICRGCRVSS